MLSCSLHAINRFTGSEMIDSVAYLQCILNSVAVQARVGKIVILTFNGTPQRLKG